MAVQMKTNQSARLYHTQQVHYLSARFNGLDISPSATGPGKVFLGVLPAGCMPLETIIRVNVAFTSGEVIIGTSAANSSALVATTADSACGTTGTYISDRYKGTLSTADVRLFIQTKSSGQTNGQVDVWLSYLPAVTTIP